MDIRVYTDGASSGNPGPAAIGVVIKGGRGEKLAVISQYLGVATNNQAEYQAVVAALKAATKLKATEVTLYLDSELIARQLMGGYRVKSPSLKNLYLEVRKLGRNFRKLTITPITNRENREAHILAQATLKQFRRHLQ